MSCHIAGCLSAIKSPASNRRRIFSYARIGSGVKAVAVHEACLPLVIPDNQRVGAPEALDVLPQHLPLDFRERRAVGAEFFVNGSAAENSIFFSIPPAVEIKQAFRNNHSRHSRKIKPALTSCRGACGQSRKSRSSSARSGARFAGGFCAGGCRWIFWRGGLGARI